MCGIVGIAGSIFKAEKDAFENLLIFSQVRGPHSTGIASVDRHKNEVNIIKTLGRPQELIDYDKRYDATNGYNKKFILGHNRWATTGRILKKNAHPFLFDNIVGCHNGTIPEYSLRDLKEDHKKYETDSEAVLANMNEYPLQDVMKPMNGAWAFVWYDVRDNTLNFLRNKERELHYTYSKDRKTIFWASEKGFLQAALNRNGIVFERFYDVLVDRHFKWVIPEPGKEFAAPRQVEIKSGVFEYTPGKVIETARFQNKNDTRQSDQHGKNAVSKVETALGKGMYPSQGAHLISNISQEVLKNFSSARDLRTFEGQGYEAVGKGKKSHHIYRGFENIRLTRNEWESATKSGCAWCDEKAQWGKPVRFISPKEHLCLVCNSDEFVVDVAKSTVSEARSQNKISEAV